jgi:hypothetical protein
MIKRTDSEIMKDITNVYCALSPENLSCDGELSAAETRGRQRTLTKRLNVLFNEIGRHVSEEEAFAIKYH